MVATLLRLRLTILRHTLRREPWRLLVLVAGGLWALLTLPSVLGGMTWLSAQPPEVVHDVLVVAGALLVVGWVVVPVVVPSLDDALDVHRFATCGVPPRRLVPGLLAAALLGVPTAFTAMVCVAPVIAWGGPDRRWALATAVLMAPALLVTCVVGARLSTGLAARLLGARRSREVAGVLGLVVVVALVGVVVGVGRLGLEGVLERVPAVARVLGWTPLGAGWAAPALVAQGEVGGGLARGVVAGATAAAAVAAWTLLLRRTLVSPPPQSGQVRRRLDAVLPPPRATRTRVPRPGAGSSREAVDGAATAPPSPAAVAARDRGAVAARAVLRRSLRYWTADPRYTGALLGSVAAPVLIVLLVATVVDAPAAVALSMAPLMAGTIGWGRHNEVAYDGSAFWLHVVTRVPGWADRLGRAGATLVWALPVTTVVAVLGAAVAGRVDLTAAAVGAGWGVLGAGLAVSAVSSAVLCYPVPAAGANPYASPPGALGASLVAQLVTSVATAALCLPVLAAYAAALWWDPAMAWVTLGAGLVGGSVALGAGVVVGGRLYDRRAVRLLGGLDRAA